MNGRYATLTADWHLRGYSDRPAVLYDWRSGDRRTLSPTGAYVARCCDGATDFTSPFFLPRHLATLDAMIRQGMAVECAPGATLDPRQRLRTAPNRYLPCATWAITGRCNLRCRHCYMDAPLARYGELPTETMLAIVDQMERANVQRVHLTGGEPLLRHDFWELCAELAARRIGVHQISTNGLLLDDDALARLRDLDLDPFIHVSFDGVGTHDDMRGRDGAEVAALTAIRRAAAAGFRVAVTSSLDRRTSDGILRSVAVLAEIGVRSWQVSAPIPIGQWTGSTTTMSLADQAAVSEAILRRWLALGRPYLITLCGLCSASPGAYLPPKEPLHRCSPEDLHCGALLHDVVSIMPDGRLIPCARFIDTPVQDRMPSLLEVELGAAWDDPDLRRLLSVSKAQVLEHNPECAACDHFEECGAGCWALGYSASGDLLGRDPTACELFHSPYRRRLQEIAAA
jgi:radical SAM protein with 4Fe4S-binding SPASM domain